jgi:hypothetical protein
MKAINLTAISVVIAATLCATAQGAPSDEAQIRALESRFAAALNAKDVDDIMKVYVPDDSLVVFDVVPPRQYVGAEAYRKDWQGLMTQLMGPVKFEITDLDVFTGEGRQQYEKAVDDSACIRPGSVVECRVNK